MDIADIDECLKPGVCHENAICGNTPGHYFCTCADGFIGDGVNECVSSLLYSYRGHQELPKDRNARVVLQLKQPLQIFGKKLDKLTVSIPVFCDFFISYCIVIKTIAQI